MRIVMNTDPYIVWYSCDGPDCDNIIEGGIHFPSHPDWHATVYNIEHFCCAVCYDNAEAVAES